MSGFSCLSSISNKSYSNSMIDKTRYKPEGAWYPVSDQTTNSLAIQPSVPEFHLETFLIAMCNILKKLI